MCTLRPCSRFGDRALGNLGLPVGSARAGPISDGAEPGRVQASRALNRGQPLKEQGPPDDLAAHFKGLGYMEQYEYREAVEAFREVHRRARLDPGAINLAIALLNDSGVKAEQAKKAGGEPAPDNFDEALGSAGRRPGARPAITPTLIFAGASSSSNRARSPRRTSISSG